MSHDLLVKVLSNGSRSGTCTLDSKTCTLDSKTCTLDNRTIQNDHDTTNTMSSITSNGSYRGLCLDNLPRDSLQNIQNQTLFRNKSFSNPELGVPHDDSTDDVNSLYTNLLNGEELRECMTRMSAVSYPADQHDDQHDDKHENNTSIRLSPSKCKHITCQPRFNISLT